MKLEHHGLAVGILLATGTLLTGLLPAARPGEADALTITHGPILGRFGAQTMGVWGRTSRPGVFRVRYGTSAGKLDQLSAPVTTSLARDLTGDTVLKDLRSDTEYHYRLVTGEGANEKAGPGGMFRTLPAESDYRDAKHNPAGLFNFSFEVGCCANQDLKHGGGPENVAYKTMLDKLGGKLHFAVMNGDWLYEEKRETTVAQWRKLVGTTAKDDPEIVKTCPTIVGVWENYRLYLNRSKNLAAWHRRVPTLFTFDDHEILNDIWGAGEAGLRDRRAVFRDIGVRAWFDYLGWANPSEFTQEAHFGRATLVADSDELVDEQADFSKLDRKQLANLHVHWGTPTAGVNDNALDGKGGDPNAGTYAIAAVLGKNRLRIQPKAKANGTQSYSIGRRAYYRQRVGNCEFFCLDTRSHRRLHDVKQPGKPGVSMLGPAQKAWLLAAMRASTAQFLFVVSSVNFTIPHVGGAAIRDGDKDEAWTVFLAERAELIRFFEGLGKPVIVLTGDLHNSFAVKISGRVWEFGCGPHNSQNHIVADEGDRPPNGPFRSGDRDVEIRWSSYFLNDIPRAELKQPYYCVARVNNVFANPRKDGEKRWLAYPRPHVVFSWHDGKTGELRYAETIHASK